MKKSLVLAMAMALGVTASAYAANPFSDVPAGHWAYDSIAKLAAAGVIEGYGDDTFRGDRLMTRYEMAQIVAKAMAKGGNVDKLAAEFADELDALGVRVAALEKKSDNVKITGNVRYHWANIKTSGRGMRSNKAVDSQLRTRLTFTGKVNDNWNYVSLIENRQIFHNESPLIPGGDRVGDERTDFQRAYLDGRLGGTKAKIGRFNLTRGVEGDIYDNRFDGIAVTYGDKVRLGAYYGKTAGWRWQNGAGNAFGGKRAWGINAEGDLGKLTLFAGYDSFKMAGNAIDDKDVFEIGGKMKFNDFRVSGAYLHSSQDRTVAGKAAKKGAWLTLGYKGASAAKVGSWGLEAKYYHLGDGVVLSHTFNATTPADTLARPNHGFKGYKLAGYYTVAKNMVAGIEWYDLKGLHTPKDKAKTLWTQMVVTF